MKLIDIQIEALDNGYVVRVDYNEPIIGFAPSGPCYVNKMDNRVFRDEYGLYEFMDNLLENHFPLHCKD